MTGKFAKTAGSGNPLIDRMKKGARLRTPFVIGAFTLFLSYRFYQKRVTSSRASSMSSPMFFSRYVCRSDVPSWIAMCFQS